jgi:hypothetical protein
MIAIVVLVILSAICSALMDVGNFHPSQLRLPSWWKHNWTAKYVGGDPENGRVKWKIGPFEVVKPVQLSDGWHFSKMVFVIANILSVVVALTVEKKLNSVIIGGAFVGLGVLWNTTFSLFYNKIFRTK